MIRKIQASKDLSYVFIPKAFIELLGLTKGQKVDVRVVDEKIVIAPVQTAKLELTQASTPAKGAPA